MNEVYLMCGIPGSGKSTWVKSQPWYDEAVICSTDHFFQRDQEYKFDASKIEEAHNSCLRSFVEALQRFQSKEPKAWHRPGGKAIPIVVDNTNLSVEEIAPYYCLARAYGHEVVLVRFDVKYDQLPKLAEINVHGVKHDTLFKMWDKYISLNIPPFWKVKYQEHEVKCFVGL